MILTISTLTLNLASVYWTIIVRLYLLKVAVTSLRCCGRLCYCSGVVKFLYFIGNSSSSHKSVFLIVFQLLLVYNDRIFLITGDNILIRYCSRCLRKYSTTNGFTVLVNLLCLKSCFSCGTLALD